MLSLARVVVDLSTGEVVGGEHGPLTDVERRLLQFLVDHAGQVVTREALHVGVWNAHPNVQSRMVDRAVGRLRRKLMDESPRRHLLSVYGRGYRLVLPTARESTGSARAPGASRGVLVGRDAAVEALHRLALDHAEVTVSGPPGVGRWRLMQEVAWRQRDRFPGGVWHVDGRSPLAPQLAALPPVRGAGADAWPGALAADGPAVLMVRHADQLAPDVRSMLSDRRGDVHLWWATAHGGLAVLPLGVEASIELLCRLRALALPHAPWDPDDEDVRQLAQACGGLPAALQRAEALARTLPIGAVCSHLAEQSPIRALVAALWEACSEPARGFACRLAAWEHAIDPDEALRRWPALASVVDELVQRSLLPEGTPWRLLGPVRTALRDLDPSPERSWQEHVEALCGRMAAAELEVHRGEGLGALASTSAELLATLHARGAAWPEHAARAVPALEPAGEHLGLHAPVVALFERFPPRDAPARAALGRLLVSLGRIDEAEPLLQGTEPHTAAALARARGLRGDLDGARQALQAGSQGAAEPWHHHTLQQTWARIDGFGGRWDACMRRLHDDLEACRADRDPLSEARGTALLGLLQAARGEHQAGAANLRFAARRLADLGERRHQRLAVSSLGQLLHGLGQLTEAEALLQDCLRSARRDGHPEHVNVATAGLAMIYLEQHRLQQADDALTRLALTADHSFRHVERYLTAWLHAHRGQCDQAAHALARGLSEQPERLQAPARVLAALLLHRSEHPAAAQALEAARADVASGDQEDEGAVASAEAALTGEPPRGDGIWGRISARWWRLAERNDWRPSAWATEGLASACLG